jgi:MFS family permease
MFRAVYVTGARPRCSPTKPSAEFQQLWAATALSNLGDGIVLVATPLLAAALTQDPTMVAGVSFARHLPWLVFPLASGVLADRLDRRRAMALAACSRSLLVGALALAVTFHAGGLALLYAAMFLLSTAETLFDISGVTLVPAVVTPDRLPRAYARLARARTVANLFIGPPLGGFCFGVAPTVPFLVGSVCLLLANGVLLQLRGVTHLPVKRSGNVTAEITEGVRWLWQQPLLRTLSVTLASLNVSWC